MKISNNNPCPPCAHTYMHTCACTHEHTTYTTFPHPAKIRTKVKRKDRYFQPKMLFFFPKKLYYKK